MKFMQINPQKARGKFSESLWTDPAWFAENKYDGDRRIGQFQRGLVRFTGTRKSVDGTGFVEKTGNLPHLASSNMVDALSGTVLDGEIVAPFAKDLPGGKSKYVTSIMGSSPEEAVRKQRAHGWLEWMVFDCLWWKGTDIRGHNLAARKLAVAQALREWGNPHAKWVDSISVETEKLRMWERSEEGLVFKHRDHTYGDQTLWVKRKKEWTADVVCMGFEPGEGKYAGSVGAIIFGQYRAVSLKAGARNVAGLDRMGTCRGFTDAQMNRLSREPKKYLGRVMEIVHNGREPTGAFRHPRFKWKWRDDKDPKDCVYREDEV